MAAVLSAGVLIGLESGLSRVIFTIIVVGAIGASILRDGYVGVVIGLGGAACLILVERLTGTLTAKNFFIIAAEVATVLTVSWLVGILGHHLRSSVERVTRPSVGTVRPAANLMGVLGSGIGLHRLDEELARRRMSGGPLGLALVSHEPVTRGAGEVPDAARRAIARHVESSMGDTEVVFALDDDTLGVILPGVDWTAGLEKLGRLALAASQATYADPSDRNRRQVSATVRIRTALVFADDTTVDARSLVATARDGLSAGEGTAA